MRLKWATTPEEALAAGVSEDEVAAAASCSVRHAYAHFTGRRAPISYGGWLNSDTCPPGEVTQFSFSFADRHKENCASYSVSFDRSSEAKVDPAVCSHAFGTFESEGEFWGGGSGSCQVEMITFCLMCKGSLSRRIEARD